MIQEASHTDSIISPLDLIFVGMLNGLCWLCYHIIAANALHAAGLRDLT
jgi:hypothetical protein